MGIAQHGGRNLAPLLIKPVLPQTFLAKLTFTGSENRNCYTCEICHAVGEQDTRLLTIRVDNPEEKTMGELLADAKCMLCDCDEARINDVEANLSKFVVQLNMEPFPRHVRPQDTIQTVFDKVNREKENKNKRKREDETYFV